MMQYFIASLDGLLAVCQYWDARDQRWVDDCKQATFFFSRVFALEETANAGFAPHRGVMYILPRI